MLVVVDEPEAIAADLAAARRLLCPEPPSASCEPGAASSESSATARDLRQDSSSTIPTTRPCG